MTEANSAAAPLLEVAFDYTCEDRLDVTRRMLTSLPVLNKWRRSDRLFVGAGTTMCLILWPPGNVTTLPLQLGIAIAAGLLGAAIADPLFTKLKLQRVRKLILATGAASGRCRVALEPECLRLRQSDYELAIPWTTVQAVVDNPADIEFRTSGAICVVRDRAFTNQIDRTHFLELARSLAAQAKNAAARN